MTICDVSGRKVRNSSANRGQDTVEIFVGDIENGVYFVNVCGSSSMETFKLIIQKD